MRFALTVQTTSAATAATLTSMLGTAGSMLMRHRIVDSNAAEV